MEEQQGNNIPSTRKSKFKTQNRKQKLSLRTHKIEFNKGYININKNQLSFNRLTRQVKYFFIEIYKKCWKANCLKDVFLGWNDDTLNSKKRGKNIELKDEDALQIIWKMMRILVKLKIRRKIAYLQQIRQRKKLKISNYTTIRKDLINKKKTIQRLNPSQGLDAMNQQKFPLQLAQNIQQFQRKYKLLLEQKQKIDKKIKTYSSMVYDQPHPMRNTVLKKTINRMAQNLLRQTIIFIIQIPNERQEPSDKQVYVVLEQSYSTILMKANDLIRLTSLQFFTQNLKNSFDLITSFRQEIKQQREMFCCHRCMQIFPTSQLKVCDRKISQNQTKSYKSCDYYFYKSMVIQSDYFAQHKDQHILPFLIYSKDRNEQLCCNRAYCNECIKNFYNMDQMSFQCPFCCGKCNCRRCQMAVALVKCIAHDIDNNSLQQSEYINILNMFLQEKSKYVINGLKLREPKSANEFEAIVPEGYMVISQDKQDESEELEVEAKQAGIGQIHQKPPNNQ